MAKHKIAKTADKSLKTKISSEQGDTLLHAFGGGLHRLGATYEEARILEGTEALEELERRTAMDAAAKSAIDAINKDAEKAREMRSISLKC